MIAECVKPASAGISQTIKTSTTMNTETRVYVLPAKLGGVSQSTSDAAFIRKSEKLGTVYSLQGFQDALNNDDINITESFIRIIEPSAEPLTFINKVYTEQTGGGIMVDYIELKDGKVITLNDCGLSVYPSLDATYDGAESLGNVDWSEDAINPTDTEQWLEDNRMMILESLVPNQDVSDWAYSIECDENLEGEEKRACMEVSLPVGLYQHMNWDIANDIVERLCGKVLGEACLTSCDDDCTMLITLEEPSFRR